MCYYFDAAIADGYFSVLAEVYMRQEIPKCEIQRLLSLILYKVVDPSRQIRDDALQMLETLSVHEWAEDGIEGSGSYRAVVVGNLPDSYQQQLDAVDIIAQHQVLTCMAPWIENLNFWKLKDSGWSDRSLKSLYYVTCKPRNISPVLDFLITKGIEDCDSNASVEISGAFVTYFSVAKRFSLYLQMLEESVEHVRPSANKDGNFVLEFSQGPAVTQIASVVDSKPHMSPLLVRGSLDGPLRNASGSLSWRTTGVGGRNASDGLHSGVGMHGVSAKELQSALQGHHQHSLTHVDIALILLAEIAYENDEDFREHLPLLFHITFVSMDSSEDIVLEHCQHLLVNLLYSLADRHLELYEVENSDGENKQQVVSLINYVQSKRGSMMWENEDPTVVRPELPCAALLSALVQSMLDAIFFQGDLRETWGTKALKWAMECTSRHLACRSNQMYRALWPCVTSDACVLLLRCLHRCLGNPVPAVLAFIMEILLTLQVIVENMEPEK
ncbi:unnamed protein product [Camellia sinensis]